MAQDSRQRIEQGMCSVALDHSQHDAKVALDWIFAILRTLSSEVTFIEPKPIQTRCHKTPDCGEVEVLRSLPESARRQVGALALVSGLICVWLAFFIGL
ncbi:MAG: hypothetical protein AAFZ14_05700 [Pseudomonadota bacterium]